LLKILSLKEIELSFEFAFAPSLMNNDPPLTALLSLNILEENLRFMFDILSMHLNLKFLKNFI